jgi:hypothetical protein
MTKVSVVGMAGAVALLLVQGGPPAGAQEERGAIVPHMAGASPAAPPMPDPGIAVVGSFHGDAREEVLFYSPGSGVDPLVSFDNGGTSGGPLNWQVFPHQVNGNYQTAVGDFTADGHEDIIWYGDGSAPDYLWQFDELGSVRSTRLTVNGLYEPIAGDFTGDGTEDVIWYAAGPAQDHIWDFEPGGERTDRPLTIGGHYEPVAGSFADDATDDVLWYGPGSGADFLWDFAPTPPGTVQASSRSMPVHGSYLPVSLDEWGDGAGGDDIVWVAPGDDNVWDFRGGVLRRWVDGSAVDSTAWPAAGDFVGDGHEDILWLSSAAVVLWDHAPVPDDPAHLLRWTYDDLAG